MKVLVFISTFGFALFCRAQCPNLTGYFVSSTSEKSSTKQTGLERFEQSNCDSVSIGILTEVNGSITSEAFPAITFYNKSNPSLCKEATCYYFEANSSSLRLFYSGDVSFKANGIIGKYSCGYDYVDYSITAKGNLKLSYQFVTYGADDPCEKIKNYTEELPRVERPITAAPSFSR